MPKSIDSKPGSSAGDAGNQKADVGITHRDGDTPRMNQQPFSVEYQVEPLHPAVWGPPRPISQSRYINGELERDELVCLSDAELQK